MHLKHPDLAFDRRVSDSGSRHWRDRLMVAAAPLGGMLGLAIGMTLMMPLVWAAEGDEASPTAPAAGAASVAADGAAGEASGKPLRRLAPGVMITILPERKMEETVSRHDLVELLKVDPKYEWAKDVPIRHRTWALEFRFKPPRMIWVDVPQVGGVMQRKLIWYMVYNVTNPGKVFVPVEDKPLGYETTEGKVVWDVREVDEPVRFIPVFLLEARVRQGNGEERAFVYRDQIVPVAVAAIQQREDPNCKLLNTGEMCREIAVGETVWGVVTWHDINPELYRFSIFIEGLTNAYRWRDDPDTMRIEDGVNRGRRLMRKTLKINFWRPGDEYFEHEGEIRYGFPGEVDYEWIYR